MAQDAESTASTDVWTVRRVLEWTTGHLKKHGSDTPRLDAEILLAHARGCPRIKLYTEYDEPLSPAVRATMKDLVQRRAAREPVAYLVGHREFFSLEFRVTPDVLIPRPDTESVVLEVIRLARAQGSCRVLDLCTGSGCIAVSVAKNVPGAELVAVDISAAALEVARANAERHGVAARIEFLEGDLLAPVPEGEFDIIVSNPPYIATAELATLDTDVRKYEPSLALDGGSDGLSVIKRILEAAPSRLTTEGSIVLEMGCDQAAPIDKIADTIGTYGPSRILRDLNAKPRVWCAALRSSTVARVDDAPREV